MEGGLQFKNKKVGVIIQARLKSTRLPAKILLPVPFNDGEPLIGHIIKRAKKVSSVDYVILATSENPENDTLLDIAQKYNIKFFQGNEDNVLARFKDASKKWDLNVIVRLTGDNPCIDPEILQNALMRHLSGKFDYTVTSGLPIGTNIEIFDSECLYRSFNEAKNPAELEHVTTYILMNDFFSKQRINFFENDNLGSLRLTVDYPTDYAFMSLIFKALYYKNNYFGIKDIKELIESNKWLTEINKNNYQKKIFKDINEEFESAIHELKILEFNNVADYLRDRLNIS